MRTDVESGYYSWYAVISAMMILAAYTVYIQPWMLDDAFISFRYAENLVAGNGLVYNVGERVEGYTCFLWIILLATGKWAGLGMVISSKVLGVIFSLGSIILLANAHYFIGEFDRNLSAASVFILGSSGVFLPWGTSGMEVSLFTFLVLLVVLYYMSIKGSSEPRKFAVMGALCGLMTLTRPEGLLIAGVIIAFHAAREKKLLPVLFLILSFLLVFLPYHIWRYNYYGYLLPNTFYAKVGGDIRQAFRGLKYLGKFAISSMMIIIPISDPAILFRTLKKHPNLGILIPTTVLYTLYIVAVGGDPMPALRFFTPLMPLISILSAACIFVLFEGRARKICVVCTILYNLAMLDFFYITPHIKYDRVAEYGKEVGLWMKDNLPTDALLATNTAGSVPYYSRLRAIDMLGLTDPNIAHAPVPHMGSGYAAHERADARYVLSRRPDFIQFASSYGGRAPVFRGDYELYDLTEFHRLYEPKEFTMPSGNILTLYERRQDAEAKDDIPE